LSREVELSRTERWLALACADQALTLALTSDAHSHEKPGRCRLVVKVVDIFGNDTSQAYEVDVK